MQRRSFQLGRIPGSDWKGSFILHWWCLNIRGGFFFIQGQVQSTKELELWSQQRLEQLFLSVLNLCEHILLDSLHPPPSSPSLTKFSKGVRQGLAQWRGNCIMPPSLPECWSIPLWTLTGRGKCTLCPLSHINVGVLFGFSLSQFKKKQNKNCSPGQVEKVG